MPDIDSLPLDTDDSETVNEAVTVADKEEEEKQATLDVQGDQDTNNDDNQQRTDLTVDTNDENEEDDEEQQQQEEQPAPIDVVQAAPEQRPYGSEYHCCPVCITASSSATSDTSSPVSQLDLALAWHESLLLACSAEHAASISNTNFSWSPAALASLSELPFLPLSLSIIGPPLSGKSSLAHKLAKELQLSILDIAALKQSSATDHVDDQALVDLVESALRLLNEGSQGWLLDGFPYTLQQAELLKRKVSFQLQY